MVPNSCDTTVRKIIWITEAFSSGDVEYCTDNNSVDTDVVYCLTAFEDIDWPLLPKTKRKHHKNIKFNKINRLVITIRPTTLTRRAMFSKSGYLPWRIRRKVKNAHSK